MNKKRLTAILAAGVLSVTAVNSVAVMAEAQQSTESEENGAMAIPADEAGMVSPSDGETAVFSEDGTPISKTVAASELTMPSQDSYEYPYMGLKAVLPEELKKQLDNADVVMLTSEDYTDDFSDIK